MCASDFFFCGRQIGVSLQKIQNGQELAQGEFPKLHAPLPSSLELEGTRLVELNWISCRVHRTTNAQ